MVLGRLFLVPRMAQSFRDREALSRWGSRCQQPSYVDWPVVRIIVWEPQAWGVSSRPKGVGWDEPRLPAGHVELKSSGGSEGANHYSMPVG